MNRPQQALVGALAGALAVLSLHPATRPFLLRPLMPAAALPQMAVLPTGEEQQKLLLYEKALGPGVRTTDDLLSIAEAAQRMGDADPKNSVWPVLEAWAQDSIDNQEAAERAWHKASLLRRWEDVSAALVRESDSAWERYRQEAELGAGFAQAYLKYVERLALDKPGEDAARWEAVQIGLTGWRSSDRHAAREAFHAGLTAALRFHPENNSVDEGLLAAAKGQLSPERYLILRQVIGRPDQSGRRQERFGFEALLSSRMAGGALLAGVAGALVFGVGSLLSASGKARSVFSLPWCVVLGALIAVSVFATTGLTFAALWSAVVFGGFAVVRDRVWRGELTDFGRAFPVAIGILAVLFVLAFGIVVTMADPSARGLRDGTSLSEDASMIMASVRGMALFWLSLVLVSAQGLAFIRRRAPAQVAARALCNFGLIAMVTGLVLAVVLTPVGLALDARLRHLMETGSMLDPL